MEAVGALQLPVAAAHALRARCPAEVDVVVGCHDGWGRSLDDALLGMTAAAQDLYVFPLVVPSFKEGLDVVKLPRER